ncbi:hypothetical protein [Novilysobacter selenitireducens]|uniref:Integrase n=1 Tax=Novilysobacter selenitireducens TaxID=2872639 RepID=A0ABS7T2J1_9GAMM|nr:hypothetical protein [Lysobacter selenitireducens]MBZ4038081.1 hypothetical protein [Lysobacter selenitireducens]
MLDVVIPDLKVEGMILSPKASGIDLKILLYKGAASLQRHLAQRKLESGELGRPLTERLPLLETIHRRWQAGVADKSLSDQSIEAQWSALKALVDFGEKLNKPFTVENARRLYLDWAAHILARSDLNPASTYMRSVVAARLIAPALGIEPKRLQWATKIRRGKRLGTSGAKENLEETGAFIQLMLETIEQLSIDVIRGPLPVVLRYGGAEYPLHCTFHPWKPIDKLVIRNSTALKRAEARRERASKDISNNKRAQLINLRLEAEMLIFINQTSCNLTQALQLTGGKFRYQSDGDYVSVHAWKNRAKHAVTLRIHKSYRPHFDAFLKWREAVFPGDPDGLTFPFVYNDGAVAMRRTVWGFEHVRRLCKALSKPFVNARQHRKTIGNFTSRRKSRQFAAELLSNSEKTFKAHYEEPNHQRMVAELVSFWDTMESMVGEAVGPGACRAAEPERLPDTPHAAPKPDCEGGAGCLFCASNRDLRSFDHAWNLASFQYLTLLQFNGDRTGMSLKHDHPVLLTVERAAAKLDAMAALDDECAEWVAEARTRLQEGRYHPHYTHKFAALEGSK